MTTGNAVEDIGFQHGIERDAPQFNAVVLQDAAVKLQILPHLECFFVFKDRLEQFEHPLTADLFRCIQVVVGDRHIGGNARLSGKGEADHIGGDIIEAVGFGIKSEHRRLL